MDKRELARQLVIGQQNLDRMKQDIHATINLILGLVGKTNDLFLNEKRQLVFESSHCKWTIQATSSKLPTGVGVICDRKVGSSLSTVISTHWNSITLRLGDIEDVYDDLPVFVETMIMQFGLQESVAPFLRAVQKQF